MKARASFLLLLAGFAGLGPACTDSSSGSSGTGADAGGDAVSATGGEPGSGGTTSATGGGGGLGAGGTTATGGGSSSGGTVGSGGASGAGGSTGACICPATPPTSGGDCPVQCQGQICAYEECSGRGLIQAACADQWFLLTAACGDNPCGIDGHTVCHPGEVCIQQVSGARNFECRQHSCGKGPITCDCVSDVCPGACTGTAPLAFTCNTCSSGQCP